MFGIRPDGEKVKSKSGLYLLIPHVMPQRVDSMNMTEFDIDLEILDEFIKEQYKETGVLYTYFDILLASIVRVIYKRPDLNRFVMNRRIYQRFGIHFSLAIQKTLKPGEESNESTLKIRLDGNESIGTIKDIITKEIKYVKSGSNETDKFSTTLAKIPYFVMKPLVKFLKGLDKIGLLPKSIIDSLPFHTTFFITDLRSVGIKSIYHHLYEFGTTGLFFSTGKERLAPVEGPNKEVIFKKMMEVKFVSDERFCDGYYFSTSFRMLQKILHNPKVLLKDLEPPVLSKREQKVKNKELARKEKEKAKRK